MMVELKGLFFAPLARVLSYIADNRDTQGIHEVATRLACNQRRRPPKPCQLRHFNLNSARN
jgi:hypothetical protein